MDTRQTTGQGCLSEVGCIADNSRNHQSIYILKKKKNARQAQELSHRGNGRENKYKPKVRNFKSVVILKEARTRGQFSWAKSSCLSSLSFHSLLSWKDEFRAWLCEVQGGFWQCMMDDGKFQPQLKPRPKPGMLLVSVLLVTHGNQEGSDLYEEQPLLAEQLSAWLC